MAKQVAKVPMLPPGTHSALKVLKFVQKLVEQEPKRLEMRRWESAFKGRVQSPIFDAAALPACGTVACLGGWINIATGHREGNIEREKDRVNPGERALKHLGLNAKRDAWWVSFESMAARALDELFGNTNWEPARVSVRLSEIMVEHAKELKAAKVIVKERA